MTYTLPKDSYLLHGSPDDYSPAKAHEYYMRTRKLHPRTGGVARQPVGRGKAVKKTVSQPTKVAKVNPQLTAQRAYAAKRVSELTAKLADLTAELQKRLANASKPKAKRTRTSADKQKATQQSKKYRTTHKQQIANKRKQHATTDRFSSLSTDEIKREIVNIKASLKAAVAAQRQQLANGHGR